MKENINLKPTIKHNEKIDIYTYQTIVVGSGAAAYNAADSLYDFGQTNIAIVTEGVKMGTSRNTGSDKQTYFKLSVSSSSNDSVYEMAKTYYNGESMHGDAALVEAASSARCFYKLVNLGVPFPHDEFGQYVGYQTDHDTTQRATSCGPLTSKYMVEYLEKSVKRKNIQLFDGYRIIRLITNTSATKEASIVGALAIHFVNGQEKLVLFRCTNIIYATGGPSAIYGKSVYPESQTCAHGAAFSVGAQGSNVTEWQYGITSTKFRWNLSGSYQQVIPRYISTNYDGSDEREFLMDYFETPGEMLTAVFLKGYQWPFDCRKLDKGGSSLVDIAIYIECEEKNRRVFLDFTKNPEVALLNGSFDFSLLSKEAYEYMENSEILFGTPITRLLKMNKSAYDLYKNNGIDLAQELLEINVSAQHNNGGLKVDTWWQSNVKGFFPVGEAAGNFGVYRPGGSALNSTQVGSMRAAQYICAKRNFEPIDLNSFVTIAEKITNEVQEIIQSLTKTPTGTQTFIDKRKIYQRKMDSCAAYIRNQIEIKKLIPAFEVYLKEFYSDIRISRREDILEIFINEDILITALAYLKGMDSYNDNGGLSRGSYIINDGNINFTNIKHEGIQLDLDNGKRKDIIQYIEMNDKGVVAFDVSRRPLPDNTVWFETIYNKFLARDIIR